MGIGRTCGLFGASADREGPGAPRGAPAAGRGCAGPAGMDRAGGPSDFIRSPTAAKSRAVLVPGEVGSTS
jgi:hypothetical protein